MSDKSNEKVDDPRPLPAPPKDLPRRGDAFRHWKTETVYVVTGVSRSEHDPSEFNVHYLPEGASEDEEIPWKRTHKDFTACVMPDGGLIGVRRFAYLGRREVPDFLRPEVAAFARLMEEKLRKNDHKGGWKDEDPKWLLDRAGEELFELERAYRAYRDASDEAEGKARTAVALEAADTANFCMMVADVCRGLAPSGRST